MALLSEQDRREVRRQLADLSGPLRLVSFTQELACQYCRDTGRLLKEVAELSDKIRLEIYNFQLDKTQVDRFGVGKVPAIAIAGTKDCGVRFYGIPLGYGIASFLGAIKDASRGTTDLSLESREALAEIAQPVRLQVFSTPT